MLLELITITFAAVNISVGCLIFFIYFKLRNILIDIKMNAEDLLVNIPLDIPQDVQHAAGKLQGKQQVRNNSMCNNNSICNNKTQNERGCHPLLLEAVVGNI